MAVIIEHASSLSSCRNAFLIFYPQDYLFRRPFDRSSTHRWNSLIFDNCQFERFNSSRNETKDLKMCAETIVTQLYTHIHISWSLIGGVVVPSKRRRANKAYRISLILRLPNNLDSQPFRGKPYHSVATRYPAPSTYVHNHFKRWNYRRRLENVERIVEDY